MIDKVLNFLGGGIVDSIGKVADELITSDEERAEKENELLKTNTMHEAKIRELDIDETKAYLEDTQSARKMNVEVQNSSSWLVRNTGSLMAWVIVIGTILIDYMVIFQGLTDTVKDKEILMFVLGALNTYTANVLSFYFGSSKTEADTKRV